MKKVFLKNLNSGFTILETMIAVSLFVIVVMVGMNSLLNANVVNQKSQSMRSIIDSLSFIMEDISKNLRTGYNYHCFSGNDPIPTSPASDISNPKSCPSGWGIAFEYDRGLASNNNDQWVYYINYTTGQMFKSTAGPYNLGSSFVQMTPDEVFIDPTSSFSVLGAGPIPGDTQQPFVTFRLVGKITVKNVITPFSLQTSVSQRLIDIYVP